MDVGHIAPWERYNQMSRLVNRVRLMLPEGNGWAQTHFGLWEFANPDGLAIVHPTLLLGLERIRATMNADTDLLTTPNDEIEVIVIDSTRTDKDVRRLVRKYGWTDEGGRVSRNTRHHWEHGGIAADIWARHKWSAVPVPMERLASVSRLWFDYVQVYTDHVHVDQRDGGVKLE